MRLEKQIYRAIWEYPTLHHNRTEALHALFIIIGNGYHWINGELRCHDDTKKLVAFDAVDRADEYLATHFEEQKQSMADWPEALHDLRQEHSQRLSQQIVERAAEKREVRAQIAQRVQEKPPIKSLYPLCEYAQICNLPDNIKEDWLLGAQEALDLALAAGADDVAVAYGPTMTPEEKAQQHQQNQLYLQMAQARINELKISRGLS